MAEQPINPAWLAHRITIGTQVKINEDAIIDVLLIGGVSTFSPFVDGSTINSEEAIPYLGQVGTVTGQSFGHQPEVLMEDGVTVIPLSRQHVTEVK